jgi:hypothetical protein
MPYRSSRGHCSRVVVIGTALVGLLLPRVSEGAGISFGQLDDFLSDAAGWSEGAISPNPPVVVTSGGPGGENDSYLRNDSSGGFGAGSKQIMFNQSQWTGDFNAAGVTRIEMRVANLGTTPLSVRIAFAGGFSQFGSTSAVELPAGSGWQRAVFNLTSAAITTLSGPATVAEALASVTEVRILSAAGGPAYNGDGLVSSLGVDSIRALRQPGDATFDGFVNFADLVVLAQNYNTVGKTSWGIGDFTFDNAVDFADLVILAQNYNSGAGTAAEGVGGEAFDSDWALAQSLVPEPGCALLLAGGLCGTVQRRRHSVSGS